MRYASQQRQARPLSGPAGPFAPSSRRSGPVRDRGGETPHYYDDVESDDDISVDTGGLSFQSGMTSGQDSYLSAYGYDAPSDSGPLGGRMRASGAEGLWGSLSGIFSGMGLGRSASAGSGRPYGGPGGAQPPSSRSRSIRLAAAVALAVVAFAGGCVYYFNSRRGPGGDDFGSNIPIMSADGKYNGPYPNSLLTLFYPYTLLRDVVLDQPVSDSDIRFFWHAHSGDERLVKRVLTECYGLDLVELNDKRAVRRAIDVNLAGGLTRRHVVTSPFLREVSEIFNTENFGRMFAIWRHPLDYDQHPSLPTFSRPDNWLTRILSNDHTGKIDFKELGVAKHVARETCVVATVDKLAISLLRIANYMGWDFEKGKDEQCVNDIVEEMNIEETFIDHESEQWREFYRMNEYDCQLYELAHSAWRAQIQTAIPLSLQLQRAEPEPAIDEDGEE